MNNCSECKIDLEDNEVYQCDICDNIACKDDIEDSPIDEYDYLCFDCHKDIINGA